MSYSNQHVTFPAAFVPGDVFNSTLIEPREPFYSEPTAPRPPDLRILKSLTPLQEIGRASCRERV